MAPHRQWTHYAHLHLGQPRREVVAAGGGTPGRPVLVRVATVPSDYRCSHRHTTKSPPPHQSFVPAADHVERLRDAWEVPMYGDTLARGPRWRRDLNIPTLEPSRCPGENIRHFISVDTATDAVSLACADIFDRRSATVVQYSCLRDAYFHISKLPEHTPPLYPCSTLEHLPLCHGTLCTS